MYLQIEKIDIIHHKMKQLEIKNTFCVMICIKALIKAFSRHLNHPLEILLVDPTSEINEAYCSCMTNDLYDEVC